jgi:hypothetical protein
MSDRFKRDDFQPEAEVETVECYACSKATPKDKSHQCVICNEIFCPVDIDADYKKTGEPICDMCKTSEQERIIDHMIFQIDLANLSTAYWRQKFTAKCVELAVAKGAK